MEVSGKKPNDSEHRNSSAEGDTGNDVFDSSSEMYTGDTTLLWQANNDTRGTCQCENFDEKVLSKMTDLHVKFPQDKSDCLITGMAFKEPNTILLTDNYNLSVKHIDSVTGRLISYLSLSSPPMDIATLSTDQAAVTIPDTQRIQIVSIDDELTPNRFFCVQGACHGIDSSNDKLVVTFPKQHKIDVMCPFGAVLQSIRTDNTGETSLLSQPWRVCVNYDPEQCVIHVTNFNTSKLLKMSMVTGRQEYVHSYEHLKGPRGVTVASDGDLITCGYWSRNVQLISANGQRARTLLSEVDGIYYPHSLCYNISQGVVFIGCFGGLRNKLLRYLLHD